MDERTSAQQQRLTDFEQSYDYDGDATCAADGMCQVKCPVKINTGELIKQLRSDELEGGEHPRATKGAMVSLASQSSVSGDLKAASVYSQAASCHLRLHRLPAVKRLPVSHMKQDDSLAGLHLCW